MVTEKKVKATRARPALGDEGAAFRATMTNDITPLATRASFRHEAQSIERVILTIPEVAVISAVDLGSILNVSL